MGRDGVRPDLGDVARDLLAACEVGAASLLAEAVQLGGEGASAPDPLEPAAQAAGPGEEVDEREPGVLPRMRPAPVPTPRQAGGFPRLKSAAILSFKSVVIGCLLSAYGRILSCRDKNMDGAGLGCGGCLLLLRRPAGRSFAVLRLEPVEIQDSQSRLICVFRGFR
jgi:hypothetical protein